MKNSKNSSANKVVKVSKSWYSQLPTDEEIRLKRKREVQAQHKRLFSYSSFFGRLFCPICNCVLKAGQEKNYSLSWLRACKNHHWFLITKTNHGTVDFEQISGDDPRHPANRKRLKMEDQK